MGRCEEQGEHWVGTRSKKCIRCGRRFKRVDRAYRTIISQPTFLTVQHKQGHSYKPAKVKMIAGRTKRAS